MNTIRSVCSTCTGPLPAATPAIYRCSMNHVTNAQQSLTIEDAETLVLKTLKQVMEEKLDAKNVQLASVTKEKGFRIYTDEEMATVVERLPAN